MVRIGVRRRLLLGIAPIVLASPAAAELAAPAEGQAQSATSQTEESKPAAPKAKAFTTGVAKGRDLLDSAISASALDDTEIEKLGARSLAEVIRTIPGIRAEAASGEVDGSYTIRGLPLAASGSKFLQFQEDGLPVLEFGDMNGLGSDMLLRYDFNLSQIQTIRGGSASTFASNSPGGVINLISKTGDVEGGAVQLTSGLDYGLYRLDMDYGAKISDTLRFHLGGFFRQGEGPRHAGYDAYKGGQFKFNITKDFAGGYIRLYGKYLDDRAPDYEPVPLGVSGTDSNPHFTNVANFNIKTDSILSRNVSALAALDGSNNRTAIDAHDGAHIKSKALGLETQFDVSGWTISEKFRYEANSGGLVGNLPLAVAPAAALAFVYGGPGAKLSYATGPNAGQAIANPNVLNGNGLMMQNLLLDFKLNSLDDMTNDLRATRSWNVGGGTLTTTAGAYHALQKFHTDMFFQTGFMDVLGRGDAALIDITTATGVKQTQDGIFAFAIPGAGTSFRRHYAVDYTIDAPYGSVNYHVGKLAIGGSVRYDIGRARGSINSGEFRGLDQTSFDMNGDGVISAAEQRVALLPLTNPAPVDYNYHYLSYSAGVNYRFSEGFAAFGRYSRGARAGADRLLFSPTVSFTTGKLVGSKGYDPVKQAEVGVKYHHDALALNLTGFWANTSEQNTQINTSSTGATQLVQISRTYGAVGAEFEGSYSVGPFRVTAGATYTKAKIKHDATDASLDSNVPRHQPKLIYSMTPQFDTNRFTIGANLTGVTSSYAQDVNKLKMPAYTTVNAFVQYRPFDRVQLSLNASNLFNALALTEIAQGSIPASGVVLARTMAGRTVSAAIRFSF
ncbi:MAG: TonB-dependent receptor [Sphingomonas sp.]|nr:TonB-dependent receptor [Sphingomonas sp.]